MKNLKIGSRVRTVHSKWIYNVIDIKGDFILLDNNKVINVNEIQFYQNINN
tara:strand:- start:224 stop:376 length:153 start_codon:yes stop_codon:yes gene_type:complete